MASNSSIFADNVVLEVGKIVGKRDISTPIYTTTYTDVTTFNDACEPPSASHNYAADPKLQERENYESLTGVYSYDPDIIFVGDANEGCSQSTVYGPLLGFDLEPIQKCMIMKMWWHGSPTPNMLNQTWNSFQTNGWGINTNANGTGFVVANNQPSDYPLVVEGRCLYMKNINTGKQLCFDIVGALDEDTLCLKGPGTDNVSTLASLDADLAAGNQVFEWYISAYQHSGQWDESQGDFRWSSDGEGATISYENHGGSIIHNRGFQQNDGWFGLRNNWLSSNIDYDMFYEIELEVGSIQNCEISIMSGSHPNSMYNTMTYDSITSTGVYKFCVPRLKKAGKWALDAPHQWDGSVETTNMGYPVCPFDGSVGLFRADTIDGGAPGSCIINRISVRFTEADTTTTTYPIVTQTGTNVFGEVDDVEWNWLDVLESEGVPFSLNFSVGDLRDIGKRSTGFSKTFKIPASNHNNEVLTPMLAVGSERKLISWMKARIKVDGIYVFRGLMRIEEGNTGDGGFFKCHIIQDGIDWTQALGTTKICDLDFEYGAEKDYDNIVDSWNNSVDNGDEWFWGLANYGEWWSQHVNGTSTHDYSHGANDFHPVVFTKPIVDKIFASIGYTVDSNFLNSQTFKQLCHPYSSGESYTGEEPWGEGGSQFVHVEDYTKQAIPNMDPIPYPCMTCSTVHRWHWPSIIPGSDVGNNWTDQEHSSSSVSTGNGGGYTVPFSGIYEVSWNATVWVDMHWAADAPWYYCNVWTGVCRNGSGIDNNPASRHPSFDDMGNAYSYNTTADVTYAPKYDSCADSSGGCVKWGQFRHYFDAGDVIGLRFTGNNGNWLFNLWADMDDIDFNIFPVPSNIVPTETATITAKNILPCTKQVDFLKGLTEMFNLQWTSNEETKTVHCEPYDDFFGSGKVVDWTHKLDYKSWNDKYIVEQLAKEITFKYKEDTGCDATDTVYRWREANEYSIYKSHTEENEEKFRKESLEMGTKVFHATIMSNAYGKQPNPSQHSNGDWGWGDLTWTDPQNNKKNPIMPYMWADCCGSMNTQNRPEYNPEPKLGIRILNYYGKINCSNYDFIDHNAAIHTVSSYPFMGWKNEWLKGVAEDPFNLHWGDVDDNYGYTSPGLFSKYWSNAYDKMNGGAALRTCMMNLNPVDIAIFDYRDLIHMEIDGVSTYWTVNKIVDYKPNQKVLTKVELVEWKHAVDINRSKQEIQTRRASSQEKVQQNEGISQSLALNKSRDDGFVLDNNTNSTSSGTGIAIGRGVAAKDNQTVLGQYNQENSNDILQIGTGDSAKRRNTAFSVTKDGEVQIQGGELVVEESDGVIHDLAYTDENGDVKKVYLKKKADFQGKDVNAFSGSYRKNR
jgi:hypothetical protein